MKGGRRGVNSLMDLFNYSRRNSSEVMIGGTPLGGGNPIRVQSMTTTPTTDTEACVEQAERIIEAGGEYVRLTTQGTREAENLKNINARLRADGHMTPLVADVHFNPHVADVAALYAEKVRINPGNYVDPARTFKHLEYTDEEYAEELRKIDERFVPFLNICRQNHTAIRIGVNHGSLSDRIMSRYGDTPEGIVESCMEFLRICKRERFSDVVISIKASNTAVMVRSVRLLVKTMDNEGMSYPLHLGVTEAGEGEDGRIKSAAGIGALLADGIGDTIRVSLSEEPEAEIPVAKHLADYIARRAGHLLIPGYEAEGFSWVSPERRLTRPVRNIGGEQAPVVIVSNLKGEVNNGIFECRDLCPDYIYTGSTLPKIKRPGQDYIVDYLSYQRLSDREHVFPIFPYNAAPFIGMADAPLKFFVLQFGANSDEYIACLKAHPEVADMQLEAAADMGPLMFDGLTDGIWLMNDGDISATELSQTSFAILQAARLRTSKTEYISCPGCGRTLYDLRSTIARIKEATKDLKGLKIGIMGCIVNGPGEMADADYGYVGAGRGRISLYRRKECVEKNIPEEEAVERLLALIESDKER